MLSVFIKCTENKCTRMMFFDKISYCFLTKPPILTVIYSTVNQTQIMSDWSKKEKSVVRMKMLNGLVPTAEGEIASLSTTSRLLFHFLLLETGF